MPVELKRHPAQRDLQQPVAAGIDVDRVLAAQIDGARRRRIHHELPRRRPDERVQLAAMELQLAIAGGAHLGFGPEIDAAERVVLRA